MPQPASADDAARIWKSMRVAGACGARKAKDARNIGRPERFF